MKIVELKNVSRYYKAGQQKNYALKNVSFGIEEGEFVVILGASGAGKSTMLNLLGGIDRADEGEILVAGEDIAKLSEKELSKYRAKRVGFVFQFYNLIPTLTVKENVELMRELKKDALGASEALQKVGLSGHERKFPEQLSGGEQQRVSIARAIAKNPDILLCDEPTGALDYNTSKEILKLIEQVNQKYGNTIIMVTHNDAIKNMADRVVKLRDGQIRKNYLNESKVSADELDW